IFGRQRGLPSEPYPVVRIAVRKRSRPLTLEVRVLPEIHDLGKRWRCNKRGREGNRTHRASVLHGRFSLSSLGLDAGGLDHLAGALGLALEGAIELRWSTTVGLDAHGGELLDDFGLLHDLVRLGRNLLDDGGRNASARVDAHNRCKI